MKTATLVLRLLRLPLLLASALAGLALASAQVPTPAPKLDESKGVAYRITRGDVLAVAVFDEPQLTSGGKKVDMRGMINLTLIQEIRVTNMTLAEAQTAIENAYRDGRYLRAPQVTITIEQYAPRVVSITGKVNAPARYELPPDKQMTLKDLILKANGFSETAKGTSVRVIRTMPDGTLKTFDNLDIDSVIRGKDKAKAADGNFLLEPDDVVYVPEKLI